MLSATDQVIISAAADSAWVWQSTEMVDVPEERPITAEQLRHWFLPERERGLGAAIARDVGEEVRAAVAAELERQLAGRAVEWRLRFLVGKALLSASES